MKVQAVLFIALLVSVVAVLSAPAELDSGMLLGDYGGDGQMARMLAQRKE